MVVMDIIFISTQSFVSQLCLVIEMRWSKQKKNNKMKMNVYNFNNCPLIRFWSFFEAPHILVPFREDGQIPDGVPTYMAM